MVDSTAPAARDAIPAEGAVAKRDRPRAMRPCFSNFYRLVTINRVQRHRFVIVGNSATLISPAFLAVNLGGEKNAESAV